MLISDAPPAFLRRPQLVLALALGLLFFVWTLRWQATIGPSELLVINRLGTDYGSNNSILNGNINNQAKNSGVDESPALTSPSSPAPASSNSNNNEVILNLSDPNSPFIGWPLRRVCNEVEEWTPGVVFLCDNNFGGVGNIRNFILTCIRYAIEAGASGLVMPRIKKRKDDDITDIIHSKDLRPFSYLFDEENFRQAMSENCPQMTLYDELQDVPHVRYREVGWLVEGNKTIRKIDRKGKDENLSANATTVVIPEPDIEMLDPRQFGRDRGVPPDWVREDWMSEDWVPERCDSAELDHHTDRFGEWFREWVTNPLGHRSPASAHNTRLFRGSNAGVLWEWPVYRDGPEFANTFGGLCKFNPQAMRLGKKALANMQAYAWDENLVRASADEEGGESESVGESFTSPTEVLRSHRGDSDEDVLEMSKFLGFHLRSEVDAMEFWPSYEMQEEKYLAKSQEKGLIVGYVASGNLTEADKFRAAAAEKAGMVVVSKADILDEEDLQELSTMSWDQQGLVDYIVLIGADYFMGNSRSSFSISVSLKRHLKDEGLYARPYQVRTRGSKQGFVVGPLERYYEHAVFIWDAMWP